VTEELESHLRDEFARLVTGGVPSDEAWRRAVERLGRPEDLAVEFAKVPPGRWLPGVAAAAALGVFAVLLLAVVVPRVRGGQMGPLLAAHVAAITLGYCAALAAGALAVWSLLARACRGEDARRDAAFRRAAGRITWASLLLTGAGVALGAVWADRYLGRAWGWDPREVGGFGVLLCVGLSAVALRRGARAGMAVAVAGNVAAGLAWLAPPLLDTKGSYGFAAGVGFALGAFVAAQLLVMALALLPPGTRGLAGRAS
jgi:Cytochrome C assembly protein